MLYAFDLLWLNGVDYLRVRLSLIGKSSSSGARTEKRTFGTRSAKALDDHFGGEKKDELKAFRAHRGEIEELARRKYLAEGTEKDGSVLIRTAEV